MKIEIDLNDILGDPDYGVETIQDSVKRQVVAALTATIQKGIKQQIDAEVAVAIQTTIKDNLKELSPKLFDDLMNAEYTPVDRYGDSQRDKTTTFRKELVKSIHEQMQYKKTSYDSDKTPFTRAVDDVVSANVKEFVKQFDKMVNEMFTRECFEYAQKKLQEKLGVK